MSAHTPGPWEVVDSDPLAITADARRGKVEIAEISIGFEDGFDAEQRANACLIAAAPELASALCVWMKYFGGDHEDAVLAMIEDGSTLEEAQEKTRAVLAKAGA